MPANTTKNNQPTRQNNASMRTNHVTLISKVAGVPKRASASCISAVERMDAFITVMASGTRFHGMRALTDQGGSVAVADEECARGRHLEFGDVDVRLVHDHAEDPRQRRYHNHSRDCVAESRLHSLAQGRLLYIHRLVKEDGEWEDHHHQNNDDSKERVPDGGEIESSALLVPRSAINGRSGIRHIQREEANR